MIALIKSSDVISPATVMFLPQYVDFTGCTEVCRFLIIFSFDEIYLKEQETRKIEKRKINSIIYKKKLPQNKNEVALFISFVSDILCYKLISPITGVVGNNYSGNSNVSVKPLYKIPYPPSTATAPRIANSNLLP